MGVEPAHIYRVGIVQAHCGCVVLAYAVQATGNDFGTSRKCLVVQAGVGCGPVRVLSG